METIILNCTDSDGTFLNILWRHQYFDHRLLSELISDIVKELRIYHGISDGCDKIKFILELEKKVFFLYKRTTNLLIAHFDPEDSFVIKQFSYTKHFVILDRFESLITFVINKSTYLELLDYEDELGKLVEDIENE